MTREDIEQMRKVAPELVEKLERGEAFITPKYIQLFHEYEKLDLEDKCELYDLITNDLKKELPYNE
jgi:hypothetical protein